jgi:L-aspartate oxidase
MRGAVVHSRRPPDILIAGAGVAGLYAAICASERGARVMLSTKGSLRASNSFFAQGGVAAAIGPDDSPALHMEDTLRVGRGLCDPAAVRTLVEEGPARVAHLAALGVAFDRDADGAFALGREGGHGRRRILHAGGSATGAAIAETLIERVSADENIQVVEHTALIGLAGDGESCDGAWLLGHDELHRIHAPMTMLATGGACALYLRSTNPPGALGDGIALAHRAGAAIRDMEFVQFHPTALAVGERAFLVSEAVRGEGALLVGEDGERFVDELAGRDVVARAIQGRLDEGLTSYLDLRHLDAAAVRARFPNLVDGVAAAGLDLTGDLIPVAPAAHYLMGGIETDLDGQSTVAGLYACGECASSGVHGANRLASNSLLECFVFAHRAVAHGLDRPPAAIDSAPPARTQQRGPLGELRRRLWAGAGPTRDATGLAALCDWLADRPTGNPVLVAEMIAASALRREESRGAHVRSDHPDENPDLARSMRCPPLHAPAI